MISVNLHWGPYSQLEVLPLHSPLPGTLLPCWSDQSTEYEEDTLIVERTCHLRCQEKVYLKQGRQHTHTSQLSNLFADDPLSLPGYHMVTSTHPVARN